MGRCGEALWPMWVLAGMEGGKSRQFLNCRDSHIELKGYATSATELRDIGYRLHRPYSSRGNFFALTDP